MLGHQSVLLFAMAFLLAFTHAFQFPEGVLPKRQNANAPLSTGASSAAATTNTDQSTIASSAAGTTTVDTTQTQNSAQPTSNTIQSTTDDTTTAQTTISSAAPSSAAPTTSASATVSSNEATTTSGSSVSSAAGTSSGTQQTTTAARKTSAIVVLGSGCSATTINPSSLTKATVVTTPIVSSDVQAYTTLVVFTSNGQVYSSTSVGSRTVASTIGEATSTISPSLQNGGGSSGSGLSKSTQKVIGGVIGGVGGAILLGGLALVAWRIWGRKKHNRLSQDEDMFSSHTGSMKHTADSSLASRHSDPLERYHNPGGNVNTASNF